MALDRTLKHCLERGIDPALLDGKQWASMVEGLLEELETLRRIRHVARSHRYAEIECMSDFGAEPRMRRWHTCLELDRLIGIPEELQG